MADKVEATAAPAVKSPDKATDTEAEKPRAKATHPPVCEMVAAAIAALNEAGGSSLQAIEKYIAATYGVDVKKQAVFIRKHLKAAIVNKTLIQINGTGPAAYIEMVVAKAKGTADPGTKTAAVGPKGKINKEKTKTRSNGSEISVSVNRFLRVVHEGNPVERVKAQALLHIAVATALLTAELEELEGNAARDNERIRYISQVNRTAIKHKANLIKDLFGKTIAQGSVLPNTQQPALSPNKDEKKA